MLDKFFNRIGYYKIDDLQAGAHCDCCGKWIPNRVVVKYWAWDICDDCMKPK